MKTLTVAGVLVALAGWTAQVSAHSIGVSRGTYQLTDRGVSAEIVFERDELGPGAAGVAAGLAERIQVSAGAEACECTLTRTQVGADSQLTLRLEFDCPAAPERRSIRLDFWDSMAAGHRHVVSAAEGTRATRALSFEHAPAFDLFPTATAPDAASSTPALPAVSWLGWIRYGVEHIWSGADHLLFLCALVLGMQTFRALTRVTLTFTLAHSLTLALAASGVIAPPSAVVEPLIAASIAFVAFENATRRRSRTAIVFAFGLVHGFGFAGALTEIGLTARERPGALLCFNLGVELGQLALLCACVPLMTRLGKREWFQVRALPCLNAALGLVSLVWVSQRISTVLVRTDDDAPSALVQGLEPLSSRASTRRANMNATSVGAMPKSKKPSTRFKPAARQAPSNMAFCSGVAPPEAAARPNLAAATTTAPNSTAA